MPKIIDHEKRREEIAVHAMLAVAKHGLEHVKLEHVAAEGGYTTGSLMHFYPSKRDILGAALQVVIAAAAERYEKAREAPSLVEALCCMLPLDEARQREWRVWLAYWGTAAFKPHVREASHGLYDETENWFKALLDVAVERGEIDGYRESTVNHLINITDGMSIRATLDPNEWTPERQVAEIEAFVELIK